MVMKRLIIFAVLCLSLSLSGWAQVKITVDTDSKGEEISPMLYGIFYEDINHAADGGIYAELVRNRSFEDNAEDPVFWKPFVLDGGKVEMALERENLLNSVQKQCLRVTTSGVGDAQAGVMNSGFWGINAVKGREYKLSLWMKVDKGEEFCAMLADTALTHCYASTALTVNIKDKGWQRVSASFESSANDKDAVLVIASKGEADFCIDVVSLFPPTYKNRPNGLRADLAEMLEELHPTFMRFPGGCFVEGSDTPDNAFRWERTIGPIENRPGHENKNWGYRTSDGLGFHEYLQLAEDINAKPLYVCNIGIWHGGVTPLDEVQMWVDECLGALEYANGPVTSKYGALRAENGHPEPFNLKYVEIGNENNQDDGGQLSDHYYDRYTIFRKAILDKYPETIIVGNVAAWGGDEPRWHSDQQVELVDEHYYRTPWWFASHFKKYDAYSRTQPDVYCGEYAVTEGFGDLGNLNAALGEAVYMMGFENNSDIVKMSSYAPIFVNENDDCWKPDMIRFNSNAVMGTPSYYVQKLMADNLGYRTLKVTEGDAVYFDDAEVMEVAGTDKSLPGIFTCASMTQAEDEIILKIVNTSIVLETATIDLGSFKTSGGKLVQLKASEGMAENTLQNPTNVYPVTKHISLESENVKFDIQPYSLNILRLKRE